MENPINLPFNPKAVTIMHIDLNSCFASIEQQANPLLRDKPVAVAAYTTPTGCIIAPSVEAKKLGVKVGMRVRDGKLLCPKLIVLPPDPNKYRSVHLKLRQLLGSYTNSLTPKSIDEFVLDLEGYPSYKLGMWEVGRDIKKKIMAEVGDFLRVSIGIAPNRFLAKTASSYMKPDGLFEISQQNYREVFAKLALMDLCGIKINNAVRLNSAGIYTVLDMYRADTAKLKAAFHSIAGYQWYLRLHGYEVDDVIFGRRSYGNSYAIPNQRETAEELSEILMKLVEKMGARMRGAGYKARGVHVSLLFRGGDYWHHGEVSHTLLFDSRDIYKRAFKILLRNPYKKPVHTLAVSCFDLSKETNRQLSLVEDLDKKEKLVAAIDQINDRYGDFVITPAQMLGTKNLVPDRVAFGGIKELEEIVIGT